jgi:branched-chain amino acid transport system ATP-binding protein
MLKLNGVAVSYAKSILALTDVSLKVGEGEIIGLFGANGAGKTTTLKAISGLLKTEQGEVNRGGIEFNGTRIDRKRPEDIVKLGVVQVIEGRRLFGQLTVEENLIAGAHLRRDRDAIRSDLEMICNEYFPQLNGLRRQVSGYLSGGEQQMLVIGRALMARPKLMLLDEPSMGLAPLIVANILRIIQRIRNEQQTSMLLVEQNVKAGLSIVVYAYIMENGRIVLEGEHSVLEKDTSLKEFYLHGGARASEIGEDRQVMRDDWMSRLRAW